MEKKIFRLIAKIIKVKESQITKKSCANDFDTWDSLNHVRIILELEKLKKKKISTTDSIKLNSIKSIIKFLK
tara:strand:- start:9389 stop:9604 length:216 start_codon:yes stop_codon:yes gene_type:complete